MMVRQLSSLFGSILTLQTVFTVHLLARHYLNKSSIEPKALMC